MYKGREGHQEAFVVDGGCRVRVEAGRKHVMESEVETGQPARNVAGQALPLQHQILQRSRGFTQPTYLRSILCNHQGQVCLRHRRMHLSLGGNWSNGQLMLPDWAVHGTDLKLLAGGQLRAIWGNLGQQLPRSQQVLPWT